MSNLKTTSRDFIVGEPFDAIPPVPDQPIRVTNDFRTAALSRLKQYLSEIIFYRSGGINPTTQGPNAPIPFQIPAEDILIGWPDNERELLMPSLVFIALEPGVYSIVGLGQQVIEESRNKYGYNTALQNMSNYVEKFAIEIWSSKKAEERCILAGIEYAMNPVQNNRGVRFRVPEYYDSTVEFTFETREIFDDENVVRNRRRSRVYITMEFRIVALIKVNELITQYTVAVDYCNDGTPVDLSSGGNLVAPPGNPANITNCCEPVSGGELVPVDPDMRDDKAC